MRLLIYANRNMKLFHSVTNGMMHNLSPYYKVLFTQLHIRDETASLPFNWKADTRTQYIYLKYLDGKTSVATTIRQWPNVRREFSNSKSFLSKSLHFSDKWKVQWSALRRLQKSVHGNDLLGHSRTILPRIPEMKYRRLLFRTHAFQNG